MGAILVGLLVAFGLMVWWAILASRPLQPAHIVKDDTYRRDRSVQKCFDCGGPLDVWYRVMRCDKCLLTWLNRQEAGEFKVDGALSVDELEKMWALK